ncbi:hypothetical protein GYMLUDRAFT_212848 [Collybiopsis luxurians FD-317 M1]|nr:hypothetical protein GYMLUDRAFT_212848 [Collybiopsis luxurians FD-317 M1]
MPSFNILSRIYRKRGSSLVEEPLNPTPEPRSSQSLSITNSTPFERRIHPDLNALAAELSSGRPEINDSRPTHSDDNPTFVSLTPWMRNRRNSSASAVPTQNTNVLDTNLETLPETTSPEPSHSDPQIIASSSSSTERPESRTNRILNRLTGLGARASPSPNPPSAWNTFGRRKSRRHNSVPHIADFGASPDVSLSNSQRSRASSNQTSPAHPADTSADLSGSLSTHSFQSTSPSQNHAHSRSQSQPQSLHTPSHPPHPNSPPSSGFTFGSSGPAFGQSSVSSQHAYPALRFSIFGNAGGSTVGTQPGDVKSADLAFDLDTEPSSQPRPSMSMPSLAQHRRLASTSDDEYDSVARPSRPRAQDIFATSSSSDQLFRSSRRRRRDTERSTGSSRSSKRRARRPAQEPFLSLPASTVVSGELAEPRRDNVSVIKVIFYDLFRLSRLTRVNRVLLVFHLIVLVVHHRNR